MTLTDMNALLKDMFPRPGERVKQWVVDTRREHAWESATSPRFKVVWHLDNTGIECRNSASDAPWSDLDHDCCYFCGDLHEHARELPSVQAWLAEKAKRPPIEQDRTKLSDEIAPDPRLASHPALRMLRRSDDPR